jgi:cyanate lyase
MGRLTVGVQPMLPTQNFQPNIPRRSIMKREELTEKILNIKREKDWTWKHVTDEIGGMSPVLVVGALLGQMKLPKPLAEKAAALFGLSDVERRLLNEVPMRGMPMPPTDPLLYRFYEVVMVNGPAWKALIEEEFGDGISRRLILTSNSIGSPMQRVTACSSPCPESSFRISIMRTSRACPSMASGKNDRF